MMARRDWLLRAACCGLASMLLLTGCGQEDAATAGSVHIAAPWSRATAPGAKVAVGYMALRNTGPEADRLMSITSTVSDRTEVHEMRDVDGVMKMRHLSDGVAVPPGARVSLAPGGYHLMFLGLRAPLIEGERFTTTLQFERGGTVDVTFAVRAADATDAHGHHH